MNLQCSLEKGISEKKGTEYYFVSIKLSPTYEKKVFLEQAELELLKLQGALKNINKEN